MAAVRKPRPGPRARPGPGSPVPAGSGPSWRSEGWAPSFDAASCADYVADVVLEHHRDAILAGKRPDGGKQIGLKEGSARANKAARGERPSFRGSTGRKAGLPLKLRRGKLKVAGTARASGPQQRGGAAPTTGTPTRAVVVIRPSAKTRPFVGRDAGRGVEYFSADGETHERVVKALAFWVERALVGNPPSPQPGERDADQV